jgi:hypothetical protein
MKAVLLGHILWLGSLKMKSPQEGVPLASLQERSTRKDENELSTLWESRRSD